MTPSGIEPVTFQIIVHCFEQLCHCIPILNTTLHILVPIPVYDDVPTMQIFACDHTEDEEEIKWLLLRYLPFES
jgi:hypothetical protein